MDWLDNAEFELSRALLGKTYIGIGAATWAVKYGQRLLQHIKELEAPDPQPTALANAPHGYVWRSTGGRRKAHLVQRSPITSYAVCGLRARGDTLSFQVGGYSQIPCIVCIQMTSDGRARPATETEYVAQQ